MDAKTIDRGKRDEIIKKFLSVKYVNRKLKKGDGNSYLYPRSRY